jgi:UDP-GlcNAc3NAcA epimerase
LPLHPRTKKAIKTYGLDYLTEGLIVSTPLAFIDMVALEQGARVIITDSGGVQKEAFFFEKPCVIMREQTEWIEIVKNGNAILAGADEEKIIQSADLLLNKSNFTFPSFYGDGKAAEFIVQKIIEDL